jgi:hypothetical protein
LKLATVTQRIEARDYVDIDALLASGLSINEGVAALLAMYGSPANALQSVKTIAWFEDGNLDALLADPLKDRLTRASAAFDAETAAAPKLAARLD